MLPGDLFYFYVCNSFNSIYYSISVWFSPIFWLQNISMTPSQEETAWFGDIPGVFHTLCKATFSQVSGQKIPIASHWNGIFKRIPELFEIKIVTFPWQMIVFQLNPRCSLFMVNRDALFSYHAYFLAWAIADGLLFTELFYWLPVRLDWTDLLNF